MLVSNSFIFDSSLILDEEFYNSSHFSFSTMVCTPASLSQEVGLALGAQAGERQLREVATAGGFTRFRRATETPFNLVLEARP